MSPSTDARLTGLLEDAASQGPFYSTILGGLSDNLMTIGQHAGTFVSCTTCGQTFTQRAHSWSCSSCGEEFGLKIESGGVRAAPDGRSFRATTRFTNVSKPGVKKTGVDSHWYLSDENWMVADLLVTLLRLPAEHVFYRVIENIGIELGPAVLRSLLAWPRFAFFQKTIQPDLAIEYDGTVVLFEFKRPQTSAGRAPVLPPREMLGHILFGIDAARRLGSDWRLVVVPSRRKLLVSDNKHVLDLARAAAGEAKDQWTGSGALAEEFLAMSERQILERVQVVAWEELLGACAQAVNTPELVQVAPWSSRHVADALHHFWAQRSAIGTLDPPSLLDDHGRGPTSRCS